MSRNHSDHADLPYDYEDFGLDMYGLQAKYPEQHPHYTRAQFATAETGLVYWEWVVAQIDQDYANK